MQGTGMKGKMSTDIDASPARKSAIEEIVAHSLGEIRSFLDELKHGSRKYRTIASLSGQIAEAYRGRCVFELLQNAHDALTSAPSGDSGQITFVLETEPTPVLLIANSGRAFDRRDFKGLCRLGQSPKDPNRSVGNKGLGFRSVLEVASAPEIWSTGTSEGGSSFVFRFTHQGIRWHVEVKATKGDDTSFDLGISEIEAATRIARRRGNTWRWRVLRVCRVLSAEPVIDWLPNPFEEGFQKHYRLHRGGMAVSYTRKRS